MPLRLISFDLDGTLVDTASEIAEAANLALHDRGLAPIDDARITAMVGGGTSDLMRRLLSADGRGAPTSDEIGALRDRFARHYEQLAGTRARAYDGCAEMLRQLRAAGLHLACVTNKDHGFAQRVLDGAGLVDCFDLLIGGDSLPQRKPDAAVLAHVLKSFGVTADAAAHVGDSRTDVETARNAGVLAWVVPWGYNAGEPVEASAPDQIFDSLSSLAAHVLAYDGRASHPAACPPPTSPTTGSLHGPSLPADLSPLRPPKPR